MTLHKIDSTIIVWLMAVAHAVVSVYAGKKRLTITGQLMLTSCGQTYSIADVNMMMILA